MKRLFALLLLFSLVGFEIPQETTIPDGAYGVFQCPCINTSSPLYFREGTGQDVVDAENSALIRWECYGLAIYDHQDSKVGEGHWNVNEMVVGSSAYLITEHSTAQYQCQMVCLTSDDGFSLFYDGKPIRPKQDELMCVCCANEGYYVAIWKYVGDVP